jgi:hypothetical protein
MVHRFLGVAFVLFTSSAALGQVYEWTDAKGVRHFSSTKHGDSYKPADLPNIMRESVAASGVLLQSCIRHGGINCSSGPDADGSVICYDGYRDAPARYRFSCSSAKLSAATVTLPGADGVITVAVRNESGVLAQKPQVTFQSGEKKEAAKGPTEIGPMEMAEYKFFGHTSAIPMESISLSCLNCG